MNLYGKKNGSVRWPMEIDVAVKKDFCWIFPVLISSFGRKTSLLSTIGSRKITFKCRGENDERTDSGPDAE